MIKKILVLSLFVIVSACSSGGSSSGGGSTGEVTRILAIGDSIGTTEFASSPWPDRVASAVGAELFNESRGGYTTSQFAGSVGGFIDQYQPSHVLILLGANDANNRFSPNLTFSNLQRMVNDANARGVPIIVGTTIPILNDPSGNALSAEMARQITQLNGATIAGTRNAIGEDPANYADNFLHPNDQGEALIASAFIGVL